MSIQEMKSKIHHLIDEEQDEIILAEVSRLLSGEAGGDISTDLTDGQLTKIEEAREGVRQGNYISLEEHKLTIAQWPSARK